MKTVIFYSYKGGQGRTTGVANVGSCLYHLGKRVVLLDLDVECPGLPPKFGISVTKEFSERPQGGIVEYVDYSVRSHGFSANALQRRVIPLASNGGKDGHGALSLIGTGPVDKRYTEVLLQSEAWTTLADRGPLGGRRMRYLDEIQSAIAGLDPPPDYLLVDLTSGITDLGTAVMTAWAAPVVMFFSLDMENIDGTVRRMNEIAEIPGKIEERTGDSSVKISIYRVLSRVSAFRNEASTTALRKEAAAALFGPRQEHRHESIHLVHSDPELEQKWFLRIPTAGKIENVRLTQDYLDLISAVFPELCADGTSLRTQLQIGNLGDIEDRYKIYAIPGTQGVMYNLADSQRNVSFKVKTFLSMIDDIHAGKISQLKSSATEERDGQDQERLYQSGLHAGTAFGKNLIEEVWGNLSRSRKLSERVQEWCHFDSSVGFGLLTSDVSDDENCAGSVHVTENFLASGRNASHPRLCRLLQGYITGVLREISFGQNIDIEHGDLDCMQMDHKRDRCTFRFYRI